MNRIKYYFSAFFLSFALIGCEVDFEDAVDINVDSGDADFSTYVSVGNSLTAGFSNNALYESAQREGFSVLLHNQMQAVGDIGEFTVPYLAGNGLNASGTGHLQLQFAQGCDGQVSLAPTATTPSAFTAVNQAIPYNNVGVPGAKSFHALTPLYGDPIVGNPFFARMATNPGVSTMISEATDLDPTFFTYWLGANDVLGYATAGGVLDSITSTDFLATAVGASLQALTANGASGVVLGVPSILSAPFFTSVPSNGLVLERQSQIDSLNGGYFLATGFTLEQLGINLQVGANNFIVIDSPTSAPRQIGDDELILLTASTDLSCNGGGSISPLTSEFFLNESELAEIESAITQYNATLESLADQFGLAYLDVASILQQYETGVDFDELTLSTEFISGGIFSLDGIHLSPRGNALVANELINTINSTYGSNLQLLDVSSFAGVAIP